MGTVVSAERAKPAGGAVLLARGGAIQLSVEGQIGLDKKLETLGCNGSQRMAAIGTAIARMVTPGSE